MADLLTPIEDRIDAILSGGRGRDGTLGVDAQARAIEAGVFRRSKDGASLRDPSYPLNQFDRAYTIEWGEQQPNEATYNQYASRSLVRLRLTLLIGHVYGARHAEFVRTIGGEDAGFAALRPRVRSNSDVHAMRRALCFGVLFGNDTEPTIANVLQTEPTAIEDAGDRLLTSVPFVVVLNASNVLDYTP